MEDNLIFLKMEGNLKKINCKQQHSTGNLTNTTTKNILAQLKKLRDALQGRRVAIFLLVSYKN
jgi:hypothetical protein